MSKIKEKLIDDIENDKIVVDVNITSINLPNKGKKWDSYIEEIQSFAELNNLNASDAIKSVKESLLDL